MEKMNEKLGRKQWDPGFINTKRPGWGVGRQPCLAWTAAVLEGEGSGRSPRGAVGGESSRAAEMFQTHVGQAAVFW